MGYIYRCSEPVRLMCACFRWRFVYPNSLFCGLPQWPSVAWAHKSLSGTTPSETANVKLAARSEATLSVTQNNRVPKYTVLPFKRRWSLQEQAGALSAWWNEPDSAQLRFFASTKGLEEVDPFVRRGSVNARSSHAPDVTLGRANSTVCLRCQQEPPLLDRCSCYT